MTSCVMMQEKQGPAWVECNNSKQSVTGKNYDTENPIGGVSGVSAKKAGHITDSVQ